VALSKTRYPIIVHEQAFRIITWQPPIESGSRRGRTEVDFTTTYAISAYNIVSSNPAQARCTRYNIMW